MAKTYGNVRLEGVEKTIDALKAVELRIVRVGLKWGYMDAAEIVRADASRRAPRGETGVLAGEMTTEWDGRRRKARVGPSRRAWYGWFQEFGTSRHPAQPFLRPALDSNQNRVFQTIGDRLKQTIEGRGIKL